MTSRVPTWRWGVVASPARAGSRGRVLIECVFRPPHPRGGTMRRGCREGWRTSHPLLGVPRLPGVRRGDGCDWLLSTSAIWIWNERTEGEQQCEDEYAVCMRESGRRCLSLVRLFVSQTPTRDRPLTQLVGFWRWGAVPRRSGCQRPRRRHRPRHNRCDFLPPAPGQPEG
jgi:hypothetical protein